MIAIERVLEHLVRQIVAQPEAVLLNVVEAENACTIRIHVATEDVARVIGSEGRILRSLRHVASALGSVEKKDVRIELVK
jgi:hypothetical protein